jgi:uncharacterized protein (TIGR02266 family)
MAKKKKSRKQRAATRKQSAPPPAAAAEAVAETVAAAPAAVAAPEAVAAPVAAPEAIAASAPSSPPQAIDEPKQEQRASARVSVSVDIHLASESHFFSGLSGDVSEGGLFLSTYRPLPIGSTVDIEFSLPGSDATLHARGEVRWLREHSPDEPRGVGIAFEELAEEDRARIHRFCTMRPPLYYEDVG